MDKTISIAIAETKIKLEEIISESNLPPAILFYMIKDLYIQIGNIADNQLKKETEEYNKQLETTQLSE